MPFDTQALTLSEYMMMSNLPIVKKIVFSLHKTMNVVQDIPFETINTFRRLGVRYIGNLPGVNWVPANSFPVTSKGKPVPYDEQLWLLRNKFQLDEIFMDEVNQIENPLDSEVEAYLEAFSYNFNTVFIQNGHPGVASSSAGVAVNDPNAPIGLRARLDFTPDPIQASLKLQAGASGTNISPGNTTATNANTFITYLRRLLYYMNAPNGEDVVLYMDFVLGAQFEACVRALGAGGGFEMDKDAFDRPIEKYKAATIRYTGYRVDQVTPVLLIEDINGNDLANQATSPGYQSIYAVKYGADTFDAWQPRPLVPRFLGLDPSNGVAYNLVFSWGVGLFNLGNRAIGRLYAIQVQ